MGGRKEILGVVIFIIRALATNPIDDIAALTVLATTHQGEANAAFFDSQRTLLRGPEQVKKKPQNGNGGFPSQGEIFPGRTRTTTNHQALSNKPQSIPMRR